MTNTLLKILSLFALFSTQYVIAQDLLSWEEVTPPNFRDFRGFTFLDNDRWIAVGGNEENDAISTIAFTNDRGDSWNLLEDAVNAQLTAITFPNNVVGYITGWNGTLRKSMDGGESWQPLTLDGDLASRNYEATHFIDAEIGFIVGGNPSNDSIQTIAFTNDGGSNWNIIRDQRGPQLNDITFVDDQRGFIVADDGLLFSTVDGGTLWSDTLLNIQARNFKAIDFSGNLGIIVGGHPTNDSIQTILISTDGGSTWDLTLDRVGSQLNDVEIIGDDWIIAVGNDGTILQSVDQGTTWQPGNIPPDVNDQERDLNHINFMNRNLGMLTGEQGKLILYSPDSLAGMVVVRTEGVTEVDSTSVILHGSIDPGGIANNAFFEFGISPNSLADRLPANPGEVSGQEPVNVQLELAGLTRELVYFYRLVAENSQGKVVGDTRQFVLTESLIPNFSFEYWDTIVESQLQDWFTLGKIRKTTSHDGSSAVTLQADDSGSPGLILYGSTGQMALEGGISYPYRPDTLAGYFKYQIAEDDAAILFAQFKDSSGTSIGQNIFMITGVSDTFQYLEFPLSYTETSQPDSLILAILSTNAFSGQSNQESVLTVDNLQFIGDSVGLIPNGDFEGFDDVDILKPRYWFVQDRNNLGTVEQSDLSTHEDFSILVRGLYNTLSLRPDFNAQLPAFPISYRPEQLSGSIVFVPSHSDSLIIQVNIYASGQVIGNGSITFVDSTTASEEFEITLNYFNDVQLADSASINAWIFNANLIANLDLESFFILDDLRFDAFTTAVTEEITAHHQYLIVPNPAADEIRVIDIKNSAPLDRMDILEYSILDATGRLLQTSKQNQNRILISPLPAGHYFLKAALRDHTFIVAPFTKISTQ